MVEIMELVDNRCALKSGLTVRINMNKKECEVLGWLKQ